MDEINFIPTIWIGPTARQRELVLWECSGYGRNKFHPYKMVRAYGTAKDNGKCHNKAIVHQPKIILGDVRICGAAMNHVLLEMPHHFKGS